VGGKNKMKTIIIMFDTLSRHFLPPYGNSWVHAPNFKRLAQKSVQFQNCYVGSMPCMPARREMHTGRYNFLHRSWGPLEPFDISMPQILGNHGIHSHKVTDHTHYWEDGGATYHNRYSTFEFIRGQEGDPYRAIVGNKENYLKATFGNHNHNLRKQDKINRSYIKNDADMPQHITFDRGIDFINANKDSDNWLLQIETFDPHEPFFTQKYWKQFYQDDEISDDIDWPHYRKVNDDEYKLIPHMQKLFAALVSFCDFNLGRILDLMDELDLWKDTMLIVNTDHGFLLGEHDWWAKSIQPFYQEIAHIPLWIWDPSSKICGVKRNSLVQTIDIAPTVLDFFGIETPSQMQGKSLRQIISDDEPIRNYALFGIHGGHVNITDGKYVYMRGASTIDNSPLYEYTLMPMHMRSMFSIEELQDWKQHHGFSFTQGVKLMQIPARLLNQSSANANTDSWKGNYLFDLEKDPKQMNNLQCHALEEFYIKNLVKIMQDSEAPYEQFIRLGLESYV
jgi:arylsulfatase A-like enzyme